MNWRFTIIDRANVSHVIDEPVGFDSIEIDIKRDENTHGIIFDYQGKDMKYYDDAFKLLKTEYDTYGSQGEMILVIEQSCDDVLTELYRGKFLFLQYDESIGDECFVKIPIENTGDVIDLTTKWDQKVDLATLVAFDGTTTLTPYSKLNFDLILPSKGILLQDIAKCDAVSAQTFDGLLDYQGTRRYQMDLNFEKVIAGEIGSFKEAGTPTSNSIYDVANSTGTQIIYSEAATDPPRTYIDYYPPFSGVLINFSVDSNNANAINGKVHIDFSIPIEIIATNCSLSNPHFLFLRLKDGLDEQLLTNYDIIYQYSRVEHLLDNVNYNRTFSFTGDIPFTVGDRYYLFHCFSATTSATQYANMLAGQKCFTFNIQPGAYFKATNLSKIPPTVTKACLINEVISRISETITNNKIRAYSDYFGRTDSQPYAVSSNGIGSMEALAKGIYIRNQQNRVVGQPNVFSLSMKDIFEGIEPIHHIGFGIEDDPARTGYKRLRVEHWKHFYTDDLIMSCIGVRNVQRKIVESKHYSTFQFGYEKYEAEQYNGLDEFLTKRTYRTILNGLKNELVKVSKFIASGYAWEITRRKNTDSSDWRFDNDTFIVCLRKYILLKKGITNVHFDIFLTDAIELYDASFVGITPLAVGDKIKILNSVNNTGEYTITTIGYSGTVPQGGGNYLVRVLVTPSLVAEADITLGEYEIKRTGGYFVETGNVDTPTNLVDPDTTYNFRISPIRNAMRWMDKIAQGYKSNPTVIFTDGTGNYFASGKMTDSFGRLENAVISENETIVTATFADSSKVDPLLAPEQLTFDFPMSIAEFRNIMANPYGKIYWENEFESGYGYISTIKYKPEEGIASFLLIPKI